jgi:ubiquinone/menaquinone biosynthesis C-methylase UbiE
MPTNNFDLDVIYEHLWAAHQDGPFIILDQSLRPRSTYVLYEVAKQFQLKAADTILDIGCGLGQHSCSLAEQFGCRVVGIDPVESNLAQARQKAVEQGLAERVTFRQGRIEAIPADAAAFDLVWCRDMLVHVADLAQALAECVRVVKPKGAVLVYTTLATELLEPQEANRITAPLGVVLKNLDQTYIEQIFVEAGLQIALCEMLDSEPVEFLEEQHGRYSKELMRLARMRRRKTQLTALFGQARYETTLALYHWNIYQLLGKLSQAIYILNHLPGS